jgi:cobalamin-dependent methionine synthase I
VSGQRVVFSLLDPSPIGVSLNDHCMMQPKKSVSFVLALGENETTYEDRPPCHGCGFPNCSYRRK